MDRRSFIKGVFGGVVGGGLVIQASAGEVAEFVITGPVATTFIQHGAIKL